jgi:Peptidase S24-like
MLENTTNAARSSWSAERSALVADALRNGHLRQGVRLRVHGESMLPTLWPGDIVEIAGCSFEDVQPGEIVLARREGRLFLHRLVASCQLDGFVLRGDSMPGPDPPFPSEALLGRLVRRTDETGVVSASAPALRPSFGANALGRKWSCALGMLFCHCGVARRLALKLHNRRKAWTGEFRESENAAEQGTL